MKILIPYYSGHTGGPSVFVAALSKHLKSQGHKIIHRFSPSFDVLLVIAECSLFLALFAKLRRQRIVQRLDGVYHAALSGTTKYLYPLKNLQMRIIHNYLADHVIYQSQFAKLSCQTMLGKRRKNTSIIYNGVAAGPAHRSFSEGGKTPRVEEAAANLTTFASFRRLDQIKPIIESVKKLTTLYHLHIYGPHTKNLAKLFSSFKNNPNIIYHGALNHDRLLAVIAQHDIFLFSDQSACPNTVLEALTAGLPVVAFNRGSIPELIQPGTSGEIVALPPHHPFQDSYPFNEQSYRDFARAITAIASDLPSYQTAAQKHAQTKHDITNTLRRYEKILSQNTPSP